MEFTIKELEQFSNIKAHTLRVWEQRHGLLRPERTKTNFRLYSLEDLQLLLDVALLNKSGIKISSLARMNSERRFQKISSLTSDEPRRARLINKLILAMFAFEVDDFEASLDEAFLSWGTNDAIEKVLLPFLQKVQLLECGDHLATELLVLSIVKQKLIAAAENLKVPRERKGTALLFSPKGHPHDILLLYLSYALKRSNFHVLYLGTNISFRNLEATIRIKRPDIVITHFPQGSQPNSDLLQFATSVSAPPIYVTSVEANQTGRKNAGNLKYVHYQQLIPLINEPKVVVSADLL